MKYKTAFVSIKSREAHAKLLKGIKNKERQVALFKQIVAMGLSVKAAES